MGGRYIGESRLRVDISVDPSVHNPKYNHPIQYTFGTQIVLGIQLGLGYRTSEGPLSCQITRKSDFDRLDLYLPPPWRISGRPTKMTRAMSLRTYHGECRLSHTGKLKSADQTESTFNFSLSRPRISSVYPKSKSRRRICITPMSRISGVRRKRVLLTPEW